MCRGKDISGHSLKEEDVPSSMGEHPSHRLQAAADERQSKVAESHPLFHGLELTASSGLLWFSLI